MRKNKKMKHKKKCLIEMRGVMWEVRFVGTRLRRLFSIFHTSHLTLHTSQNYNSSN